MHVVWESGCFYTDPPGGVSQYGSLWLTSGAGGQRPGPRGPPLWAKYWLCPSQAWDRPPMSLKSCDSLAKSNVSEQWVPDERSRDIESAPSDISRRPWTRRQHWRWERFVYTFMHPSSSSFISISSSARFSFSSTSRSSWRTPFVFR